MNLHESLIFLAIAAISISMHINLAEDDNVLAKSAFSVGLSEDSIPEITSNIARYQYSSDKSRVKRYFSSMLDEKRRRQANRQRRSATVEQMAPPKQTYHIEVFVVADNTLYKRFNDTQKVIDHIHELFHMVDTVYHMK